MSLSVDVYTRTPEGGTVVLPLPSGASDLAGFESWRHDVWGSARVCALRADLFPRLAADDLYVEPADVPRFRDECALLRAHLETVAEGVDRHRRSTGGRTAQERPDDAHAAFVAQVSVRLANIEDAARRALALGAGVLVW